MLGSGATLRARSLGPVFTFEITPQSGRPAPAFFLACRRSPLRPGRVNGDRLEVRLRRAQWLVRHSTGEADRFIHQLDERLAGLTARA
jgi:hypothetical protein